MVFDRLPTSAKLVEVGLRDGLQAVSQFVSTDHKLELLHGILDSGVTTVEITSFAYPKVLPQFSDAERIIAEAPRRDGVHYKALVPNVRGAQRACETQIEEIVAIIPVDRDMAAKNQNSTPEQLLHDFASIVAQGHLSGKTVSAAVATAFFAPCHGAIDTAQLDAVVERVVDAGADSLYLAGTSGVEIPNEFYDGVRRVKSRYPAVPVGVHLHNRNGFGTVNALASLSAGADWIEASFGGLGGDMWFPGDPSVLGNAPMEDVVALLDSLGIETGVDLEAYLAMVRTSEGYTGTPSYSFVSRGGTRQQLADAQWPV